MCATASVIDQAATIEATAPAPLAAVKPASPKASTALWIALLSRLVVLASASGAVLVLGFGPPRKVFAHAQLTHGFGAVGNVLLAGSARWDAAWYLLIAKAGYAPSLGSATVARAAFFPLYPLLIKAFSFGAGGIAAAVAGVAVSLIAFFLSAVLLYKLAYLELTEVVGFAPASAQRGAAVAVAACGLGPVAFFFSAIYPESLFLCLSLAAFWFARSRRFLPAGACAGLAAATRPTGVVLVVPLLLFYLYGTARITVQGERLTGLQPRFPLKRDLGWLLLCPLGLIAFSLYLVAAGGSATAPFSAESLWGRSFAGPLSALIEGASSAWSGLLALLGRASSATQVAASHNVELFGFALFALLAVWGTVRRLPLPYGAYMVAALLIPLSYPAAGEPLMSLPRFLLVLFPTYIWLGSALAEHRWLARAVVVGCALSLVFFTGAFATWHWVS